MKKNTNLCVDLKTIMQEDVILNEGQGYHGVLTRDGKDHYPHELTSAIPNSLMAITAALYTCRTANTRFICELSTPLLLATAKPTHRNAIRNY